MALSRASSLPALAAGNPFWSEGANLRLQVAVARPQDLPAPSDDELEETQPLGRRRARSRSQLGVVDGGASSSRAEVGTGASRTSFATAFRTPASWITSKKVQSVHENQADQSSQLHREGGYESQRDTAAHGTESGGDSVAAGPWCLSHFAKPKSGSKDWWDVSFQAQGWAIRVLAMWRIRPFHPAHRLTPVNTAQVATERTTLRFEDGTRPVITIGDWQDPSCARGTATKQWKGFTFFRLKPDPDDPNYGFEFIEK